MRVPRLRPSSVSPGIKILPARVTYTTFYYSNEINCIYTNKLESTYEKINNSKEFNVNLLGANLRLNQFLLSKSMKCYSIGSNDSSPLLYGKIILGKQKVVGSWFGDLILLSGDVEVNPGPFDFTLITLNGRGLKNENKFKQLLNRLHHDHNGTNVIVALQETHVEFNNLNYTWRGKHVFTKGEGSKGGIITLLNDNVIIKDQIDIGHEAHIALIEILDQREKIELIVVNLHSPCAHNKDKINFFETIKREIDNLTTKNNEAKVIVMGDYNTTFNNNERQGTIRSKAEIKTANSINRIMDDLHLKDCWEGVSNNAMTWRHGDKMSRLDRIQWSSDLNFKIKQLETDWSYTQSDHCAVVIKIGETFKRKFDKIVRIDTFFMNNVLLKHKFITELNHKIGQLHETDMNPHQRLEYLKMSIRSTALEIASNHKKEQIANIQNLRRDIAFWQTSFERAADDIFKKHAQSKLEEVICKRDKMLDTVGEFICNRLKSKWYQEGEKGTKYFLNMQKARGKKLDLQVLTENSALIEDPDEIDKMVETFYKNLYEKGDSKINNIGNLPSFLSNLEKPSTANIIDINKPLTLSDLRSTLDTCKDSSPGPDGIPYSLIKFTWPLFGPMLLDSWNYAIQTGSLTHSHEDSYLKLLPKEGKDLKQLKNWRPITLSNCDIKIITKSLANTLSRNLTRVISESQTAYMKDRQITDNLHIIQYAIEKSSDLDIPSMIVSLDAEKAFDSVEHWYIREVLKYLGLESFVNIFNLLYSNQKVSIHINSRVAGRYNIRHGVKQGDALSCILFILAVEPLLRNINRDDNIIGLNIKNNPIPKALAYADDVACIIHPDQNNLQRIFNHYQTMSDMSGLNLNADKTEIIRYGEGTCNYNLRYNQSTVTIKSCEDMKLNGIFIGYNISGVRVKNFEKVYNAMDKQLRAWTSRGLSLMGKIQIYKTFGLSQILFASSTIVFSKQEEMRLTNLIYKFIWNRNMESNKAPDRIKRSILNLKVSSLGFGMIDFKEVVMSIRVKNVIRLLSNPNQPMHAIIRSNINSSTIKIKCLESIRPAIDIAINKIRDMWSVTIKNSILECSVTQKLIDIVLNEYVGNLILPRFENKRLALAHRHDRLLEIENLSMNPQILKKMDKNIQNLLRLSPTNLDNYQPEITHDYCRLIPIKGKMKTAASVSSKELRLTLQVPANRSVKMISNPDEETLTNLGYLISKLTNIRSKTIILRAIHGDIYCGTRLKKFGMSETDLCTRCDNPETIAHQLKECTYVSKIWDILSKITGIKIYSLNQVLGHDPTHDKTTLTLHAEIIRQLMAIDRPTTDPLTLVTSTVRRLSILEKGITKFQIQNMLNELTKLT